ncbi:MAG: class I SAM-dependent methyltransferase [Planctomycetota bacterium]
MSTSKDFGLQFALSVTKSNLLHFGLWEAGETVTFQSIPEAQQKYAEEVLKLIPENTHTILDIGCGTGVIASQLVDRGFKVDCVSPDTLLNQKTEKEYRDKLTLYCSKFEDLEIDKKYDLLLMMESCQYLRLERSFQNCQKLLNSSGAILISDTFRVNTKRDYKDWHVLDTFLEAIKKYGFKIDYSRDITKETAPTAELGTKLYADYMLPISKNLLSSLEHSIQRKRTYRLLWRIVKKIFRKRIDKMQRDFYEKVPKMLDKNNYLENVRYMIFLLKRNTSSTTE